MKIKPVYLYSKRLPFDEFTGLALLIFVIAKKVFDEGTQKWERPTLTEHFKRHETIHVWQQVCLFLLGLVVASLTCFVLRVAGASTPWWVWSVPVVLPFLAYALLWLIELILPPYKTAYLDSPFEREARENQFNKDFKFIPFSWVTYFRPIRFKRN